jgi:aminoglycoside phosphotransferase (APT) family kinase protein
MTLPDPSTFIARGASAEVFRLEDGLILKLFHEGIDPSIIGREFALSQAVHDTGLPVARPVGMRRVSGAGEAERQGIVYTELVGPNLLAYIRRHPFRMRSMFEAMADLQRRIHEKSVPDMRSRRNVLIEDIEIAPVNDRLREAAVERLEQLIEGSRLSHGDLHPANIIVTADGLAIIDWSKAARASPAADVVRTEMLMRFGPGEVHGHGLGMLRDAITSDYVKAYRRLSGMEAEALSAWRALVGLAWLRNRLPARDAAFERYLAKALETAGLPPLGD